MRPDSELIITLRMNPHSSVFRSSMFSFSQIHIAFLVEVAVDRVLTERGSNSSWAGKPDQISSFVEL